MRQPTLVTDGLSEHWSISRCQTLQRASLCYTRNLFWQFAVQGHTVDSIPRSRRTPCDVPSRRSEYPPCAALELGMRRFVGTNSRASRLDLLARWHTPCDPEAQCERTYDVQHEPCCRRVENPCPLVDLSFARLSVIQTRTTTIDKCK